MPQVLEADDAFTSSFVFDRADNVTEALETRGKIFLVGLDLLHIGYQLGLNGCDWLEESLQLLDSSACVELVIVDGLMLGGLGL